MESPTATSIPLSILDLAIIGRGETATDAFRNSVQLARRAEAADIGVSGTPNTTTWRRSHRRPRAC
jgi:hypothetical protein